jgi:hypothetical protein
VRTCAAAIFIVEVNADRRSWTTGQRAMAVAIGLVEAGKRRDRKFVRGTIPETSRAGSRSRWTEVVSQAGIVLDHRRDLADAVLAGTVALDNACRGVRVAPTLRVASWAVSARRGRCAGSCTSAASSWISARSTTCASAHLGAASS